MIFSLISWKRGAPANRSATSRGSVYLRLLAYRYVEAQLLRVARRHLLRAAPAGGDYSVRVLAPRAAYDLAAFAVGDRGYSAGDDYDYVGRFVVAPRAAGLERRGYRLALVLVRAGSPVSGLKIFCLRGF